MGIGTVSLKFNEYFARILEIKSHTPNNWESGDGNPPKNNLQWTPSSPTEWKLNWKQNTAHNNSHSTNCVCGIFMSVTVTAHTLTHQHTHTHSHTVCVERIKLWKPPLSLPPPSPPPPPMATDGTIVLTSYIPFVQSYRVLKMRRARVQHEHFDKCEFISPNFSYLQAMLFLIKRFQWNSHQT